jgi:late competence protein required for DNA uptake (superfamily II DNA/RNA helicase)
MSKRIVICKYCGKLEYWDDMTWLNSHMYCRQCYKSAYQDFYKQQYKWNDKDGNRPTQEEYEEQEERKV